MEAMYVREETKDLLPGEPYCAPLPFVMVESHIELVRKLHNSDHWVANVSRFDFRNCTILFMEALIRRSVPGE